MKRITFQLLATLLIVALAVPVALAQNSTRVEGNGNITTETRALGNVTSLDISFYAKVIVTFGEEPKIKVTADENIIGNVLTEVKGNQLTIDQKGWVESDTRIVIEVHTNSITKITQGAWGGAQVYVNGIDALEINNEVGNMVLTGSVGYLKLNGRIGTVNAIDLAANEADVAITGTASVLVNAKTINSLKVSERGKFIYADASKLPAGTALNNAYAQSEWEARTPTEVKRVSLKLFNNSGKRIDIRIEGPSEDPFGYGTDIAAKGKKKEHWPIGTRIFQVKADGTEQLLATIQETDENQLVPLF